MRSLLLWASQNGWMKERFPRYPFVRRAVSRFMPGEDVKDALAAAAGFEKQGISTILTLLGENVKDEAEARAAAPRASFTSSPGMKRETARRTNG